MNYESFPKEITIFEVAPPRWITKRAEIHSDEKKIEFVNKLTEAGCQKIEVTGFVHPKWVPQLKDAKAVFTQIQKKKGVVY